MEKFCCMIVFYIVLMNINKIDYIIGMRLFYEI